jgi:hypothetical protein
VKPSGILWRKTAKKMSRPRGTDTRNPEAMDTPSKKVWVARPTRAENPTAGLTISSWWTSSPKWKWGATVCSKKWTRKYPPTMRTGAWGERAMDTGTILRKAAASMKPAPRAMKYLRTVPLHRRLETTKRPPATFAAAAANPKRRLQASGLRSAIGGWGA